MNFRLNFDRLLRWAATLMALPVLVLPAQATTNSNRVDVTLAGTVAQTIALVVANPAVVFGVLTPGTNNAAPVAQQLAITSTWSLSAGQTVKLYGYFDSSNAAMTGTTSGNTVPASAMTASMNGGTAQSFTATSPFSAGSSAAVLYSVPITAANAITAARLDNLALAVNLAGISLSADAYTGVMHLQAQAL